MKGLVLSGGNGVRLRPLTHTRAKQLVPVANKPVLFYGLESLKAAGITDVGIIVGDTREEIQRAVTDGSSFGLKVTYIEQEAPLGIAHAVLAAEDFLGDGPFVVYLGDNLLLRGFAPALRKFEEGQLNCQILLSRVAEPNRFGVALVDGDRVIKLEEKPLVPTSDLALVGVYFLDKNIFQAARAIKPSGRGELEITDALQWLLDHGFAVGFEIVKGWWKDTGQLQDLLEANRLVLDSLPPRLAGQIQGTSQVEFKVVLEPGSQVVNSTIRGPALIGKDSQIINSYVGPFTSIGDNCRLENCEVEHSILMNGCHITHVGTRITDSLLGENCRVFCLNQRPRACRLMLGDNSQLEMAD